MYLCVVRPWAFNMHTRPGRRILTWRRRENTASADHERPFPLSGEVTPEVKITEESYRGKGCLISVSTLGKYIMGGGGGGTLSNRSEGRPMARP